MNFLTSKKFSNKLIIILIFLTLFNFIFPCIVKADEVYMCNDGAFDNGEIEEFMDEQGISYSAEIVDKWYKMDIDIGGVMYAGMFWIVKSCYSIFNNIFCDSDHKFYYKVTSNGIDVNAGLSAEAIIKGKFLLTNPNIFEKITEENVDRYYDGKKNFIVDGKNSIRDVVSGWYYALRNFSIVAMLIVLVYIAIRMVISSVAQEKTKYKTMFKDWFIALCLLFLMQYIMIGLLNITSLITDAIGISGSCSSQVEGLFQKAGMINQAEHRYNVTVDGEQIKGARAFLIDIATDEYEFYTLGDGFVFLILILIVGFYTVLFTFKYLKRMFIIIFLILLGPITCITYPIDKIKDNSAQAYNKWFSEILYNILVQPFHLLIYTVLVGTATELANENIFYAICCFAVILPAEKFIRSMFGFKNSLGPDLGDLAKMKMMGDALHSLRGGSNPGDKGKKDDPIEFDTSKSHEYSSAGEPRQRDLDFSNTDDTGADDTGVDDTGVDDTGVDDTERNDKGVDDTERNDTGVDDTGVDDTERNDKGVDDTERNDKGVDDTERNDKGVDDTERNDTGVDNTERNDKGEDVENKDKKTNIVGDRLRKAASKVKGSMNKDLMKKYGTTKKGKIFRKIAGNSVKSLARAGFSLSKRALKTGMLYASGMSDLAEGYLKSSAIRSFGNISKSIKGATGTVSKYGAKAFDSITGIDRNLEKYKKDGRNINNAESIFKEVNGGKSPSASELENTLEKMYTARSAGIDQSNLQSVVGAMLGVNDFEDLDKKEQEQYINDLKEMTGNDDISFDEASETYNNNETYKAISAGLDNNRYSKKDLMKSDELNSLYDNYVEYFMEKGLSEEKADAETQDIIFKIADMKGINHQIIKDKLNTLDKREEVKLKNKRIKTEQARIKLEKPYVAELKSQGIKNPTKEQIELHIELHGKMEQAGFSNSNMSELMKYAKNSGMKYEDIVNKTIEMKVEYNNCKEGQGIKEEINSFAGNRTKDVNNEIIQWTMLTMEGYGKEKIGTLRELEQSVPNIELIRDIVRKQHNGKAPKGLYEKLSEKEKSLVDLCLYEKQKQQKKKKL